MTLTTTAPVSADAVVTDVRWSEVDADFWVAHRDGDYAGCVDGADGTFATYDPYGDLISRAPSFDEACALLRRTEHPSYWARKRRKKSLPFAAATAAGLVATTTLLTAGALAPMM